MADDAAADQRAREPDSPVVRERIDIPATATFNELSVEQFSDLDLSYTPPLGSPWDAVQIGAQTWTQHVNASHAGV